MGQQQIDIEEKIAIATEGLAPEYVKALHSVSNKDNVFACPTQDWQACQEIASAARLW